MTATMILKEIQALPPGEKASLFQELERGRTEKTSESQLFQIIETIGRKMRTSLTADEMIAARLEGRK
jgi:hypothetical protein